VEHLRADKCRGSARSRQGIPRAKDTMNELSPIASLTLGHCVIGIFTEKPAAAPVGPYVWVGNFKITLSDSREMFHKGALGVYPTEAFFLAQKDAEVESREKLIRSQFSARNLAIKKIELLSVDPLPVR